MPETPRHISSMPPSTSLTGRVLLRLACAALLLGGAAQARHDACDSASARATDSCLARVTATEVRNLPERGDAIATVAGVTPAAAGGATLAAWSPERRTTDLSPRADALPKTEPEAALAAGTGDPSWLGLLLAALGVVGFVAHRRNGRY